MGRFERHRRHWRALLAVVLMLPAYAALADFTDAYNAAARREWDVAAREFGVLADQGDARAQAYLATLYRNGLGVPRDFEQAVHWYALAAEQGHLTATYNLAVHYREGLGVARDETTELFAEAARKGMVEAQINLGLRLIEGSGTEADPVRGLAWLEKAAQSGNGEAVRRRDYHARRLTAEQRQAAIELSGRL